MTYTATNKSPVSTKMDNKDQHLRLFSAHVCLNSRAHELTYKDNLYNVERAGNTTQWVKVLATKASDLNSITKTHMV